jgi:hypothetical protein
MKHDGGLIYESEFLSIGQLLRIEWGSWPSYANAGVPDTIIEAEDVILTI